MELNKSELLAKANAASKNTLMETLDIEIVDFGIDTLTARMPVTPKVHQPDGILHGGCPHSAEEELRMILGATSIADTEVKLKEVCENAWGDLSVPFSDIDSDFSDEFMNQYFKGETYLNSKYSLFFFIYL